MLETAEKSGSVIGSTTPPFAVFDDFLLLVGFSLVAARKAQGGSFGCGVALSESAFKELDCHFLSALL